MMGQTDILETGAPGEAGQLIHGVYVREREKIPLRPKAYASPQERRAKMLESVRHVMEKHQQVLDALAKR